jgi:hypothetical protein
VKHVPVTTDPTCAQADLQVQVLTNYCGTAQVQQFLQLTNLGATPANLSSISIKLWVDDTSGSNMVPSISTGGCVTDSSSYPNCVHQVTGASVAATALSATCGPDSSHQGNWEIKVATTDSTLLGPGQTWTNIQLSLHTASYGNFSPGTSSWYSPCLAAPTYTTDHHFAVHYADIACTKTDPCAVADACPR